MTPVMKTSNGTPSGGRREPFRTRANASCSRSPQKISGSSPRARTRATTFEAQQVHVAHELGSNRALDWRVAGRGEQRVRHVLQIELAGTHDLLRRSARVRADTESEKYSKPGNNGQEP